MKAPTRSAVRHRHAAVYIDVEVGDRYEAMALGDEDQTVIVRRIRLVDWPTGGSLLSCCACDWTGDRFVRWELGSPPSGDAASTDGHHRSNTAGTTRSLPLGSLARTTCHGITPGGQDESIQRRIGPSDQSLRHLESVARAVLGVRARPPLPHVPAQAPTLRRATDNQ